MEDSAPHTLTIGIIWEVTLSLSNLYTFIPRESRGMTRRSPTVHHTLGSQEASLLLLPRGFFLSEPRALSATHPHPRRHVYSTAPGMVGMVGIPRVV